MLFHVAVSNDYPRAYMLSLPKNIIHLIADGEEQRKIKTTRSPQTGILGLVCYQHPLILSYLTPNKWLYLILSFHLEAAAGG
jgi:hypothetical protein